ncbi:hypothetical protein V8E52_007983 [Russula decolorans]
MPSPPSSPERMHHFSMGITPSPPASPERMHHFRMDTTPLPSPEQKDDSNMSASLSILPVLKNKSDFGFREPLFLPDSEDNSEAQAPVSLLPHAKDFGIIPIPDKGPSQTGTHQPTEAKEPLGSSSKERAWIWGQRAPSQTDNKQEGQYNAIGSTGSE